MLERSVWTSAFDIYCACSFIRRSASRGHVCSRVDALSAPSQENVALVVCSAQLALAWHQTVPDTVPVSRSQGCRVT